MVPAVYKATSRVTMLNLSEKTKMIPKGTMIGKVTILQKQVREPPEEEATFKAEEDTAELFKKLQIDENQLLNREQKKRLKTLIYKYKDVFSAVEGEVGATTLT